MMATIDLLIATPVALGMTGSATLAGVSFTAHAARKKLGRHTRLSGEPVLHAHRAVSAGRGNAHHAWTTLEAD